MVVGALPKPPHIRISSPGKGPSHPPASSRPRLGWPPIVPKRLPRAWIETCEREASPGPLAPQPFLRFRQPKPNRAWRARRSSPPPLDRPISTQLETDRPSASSPASPTRSPSPPPNGRPPAAPAWRTPLDPDGLGRAPSLQPSPSRPGRQPATTGLGFASRTLYG